MAERRLYFALWPDEGLRERLVRATADVRAAAGGRGVAPADYHVTLAFLGAVPAERVEAAVGAGRAASATPGAQVFDRVECWGRRGPLVVGASVTSPALAVLEVVLRNSLDAAGFALAERGFRPHITLARDPAARVAAQPLAPPLAWPYADFVLVESHLGRSGARYEVLDRFPCRPAAQPPRRHRE